MRGNKVEGRLNEVVHDLLIAMHLPARQPPGNRNLQRDRGALMAWRFYASLLLELIDGREEENDDPDTAHPAEDRSNGDDGGKTLQNTHLDYSPNDYGTIASSC